MVVPVLYLVIPCYNEEKVLLISNEIFLCKMNSLIDSGAISQLSRILYVDDGSKDNTWNLICGFSSKYLLVEGISQSRNRGHQNALLAGLLEAREYCDITISIDCDGQDDIDAIDRMLEEYANGAEIVYGVRNRRQSDTPFKRYTAQGFYKFLTTMGVEVIYNHADYRLVSRRVLQEFSQFTEVNLFLRGMFPLVGFKSTCVYYERHHRLAGASHYPLRKMLGLAIEGITSLSIKPLHLIVMLGVFVALFSFIATIWAVAMRILNSSVPGWASLASIMCFLGGIQLISVGIIGEYVGKIYLEVKRRPRYIISKRTDGLQSNDKL